MLKRLLLLAVFAISALALSGCHNSDNDTEEASFDTIGEQHVYDLPKKAEPVRALPVHQSQILQRQPAVATQSYDHIGEENVFDN